MSLVDRFYELDVVYAYRLLQLRLMIFDRRMSYSELGQELGVSDSYLSKILNAKVLVDTDWLDRIDRAVDRLSHQPGSGVEP